MSIELCDDAEAPMAEELPVDRVERIRRNVGLAPLTAEGRLAIEWAIAQQTPPGVRLQALLELGEQLGSLLVPSADMAAWGRALAQLDTVAYCARLIEAQIIAGNTGFGIMLPDRDLEIDAH